MVNYESELMYALDSKGEYADWKNNVRYINEK